WRAPPRAAGRGFAPLGGGCWGRRRRLVLRRPRCNRRVDFCLSSPAPPPRAPLPSLGPVPCAAGPTPWHLRQLHGAGSRRLGIEEYDPAVAVTDHRLLRLEADTLATQFGHRTVDVFHL